MQAFSSARAFRLTSAAALLLLSGLAEARAQTQAIPDDVAYKAARAQTDPETRIAGLQTYLSNFPNGPHTATAQDLLLQTFLNTFPDRASAIRGVAQQMIASAPAGLERWIEETHIATLLSAAGPGGVDLPFARSLADDAIANLTEAHYQHEVTAAQLRYKLPRVPPRQVHAEFVKYRASFLASEAAVQIKQHQLSTAAPLLDEAYKLQPLSAEVNLLRAELALAQNQSASALDALERADAMGALDPQWKAKELQLFKDLQHGDSPALERRVDGIYRNLYPPPFSLPKRQLAEGGHTVLLELFTGSGCQPCAGPDLAIDSLLGSYSRQDLAILAWDEPIPLPDPLTNPDSINRAAGYSVGETPTAFLDGQPLDMLGGARTDVENIVIGTADQVEEQAARPSGLHVTVSIDQTSSGHITVRPAVKVTTVPTALASVSTGDTTLRRLSQDVLYVALAQDNVHYSGENGIRLHRMVVRSVARAAVPQYLTGTAPVDPISFDIAELDKQQNAFLDAYEEKNDRFGTFRFTTKDLPISGGELAVVAWVQDPTTHQVLQTAYAAIPAR